MFIRNRAWQVDKAESLTAIYEPIVDNIGSLTSHNPIGLHGLLRGQLYFLSSLEGIWKSG
jgi:hypothetical protein